LLYLQEASRQDPFQFRLGTTGGPPACHPLPGSHDQCG